MLGFLSVLLVGCTDLDDNALPLDSHTQIYFQTFELNPERNYVLGKLINNSPYLLTSCRFRINFYPELPKSEEPLTLRKIDPKELIPLGKTPTLSKDFFIREPLKPGYSTEVYFEIRLNDLNGSTDFTREIIELKGRVIG